MSNGQFWCKKCANIPSIIKPSIDKDNTWKIKVFTVRTPDRYFETTVNEFLSTLENHEIKTSSCMSQDLFVLTIMYKEK